MNSKIQIGELEIDVVTAGELIESFDSTAHVAGVGPGLHFHTRMDEIFYIVSGQVMFTIGSEQILAGPGQVLHAPKGTPHAWHSHEGPARLLITFVPGGNQRLYLTELGELSRSGASWRESIGALQSKYDNTPL